MNDGNSYLFFGGPYSNIEATRAVLREAERRGIPSDRVVCTGDVVAYGANPKECVTLMRNAGIRVVMGNCEEQLAADADDCGCGFAPGSACDQLSVSWYGYARARLDASDRAWMANLPRRIDLQIGGKRFAAIHGSTNEINRFVFLSTPERVKATDLRSLDVDGIIAGHSGLPFSQSVGNRFWHNPGVIGMPANDGTPRVWFSVLTAKDAGSLAIEHVSLRYDCESAADAIRRSGLPTVYADALVSGNWPNCEILPPREAAVQGTPIREAALEWAPDRSARLSWPHAIGSKPIDPGKFRDRDRTADGSPRAKVDPVGLKTLWINTGTVCNLQCASCYIESTPRNDRLSYISVSEVEEYLDEIARDDLPTEQIGFTGGEPFMNPEFLPIMESALQRRKRVLILTNAMKPMQRVRDRLLAIKTRYGESLAIRVSVDHYTRELHELERGPRSWKPTLDGLAWLARNGFQTSVAGRLYSGEVETIVRSGYARLFHDHQVSIDAFDPKQLVLFPEMDERADVPEISDSCWNVLNVAPADMMCATSRMVVKRRGADKPVVVACTLTPYEPGFELGTTLREASRPVSLNHPHCATFCVLGGSSCSGG